MYRPKLYGYPKLGREGLAHSLLAWARCAVWCDQVGAEMIAPKWFKLRVGPLIRRERDLRNYHKQFISGNNISGIYRNILLVSSDKLYAELDLPEKTSYIRRNTVVVFRNAVAKNEEKFFHYIIDKGPFLKDLLIGITKESLLPKRYEKNYIAIHVRFGDFQVSNSSKIKDRSTNVRLDLNWYISALARLRSDLGQNLLAVVYSDASDLEIKSLLDQKNTIRAPKSLAVTDLLGISNATAMIGSISGFSYWGSFLGNVPLINYPGQNFFQHFGGSTPECEFDGNNKLDKNFLQNISFR